MTGDRWLLTVHLVVSIIGLTIISYQATVTARMLAYVAELVRATHESPTPGGPLGAPKEC
jgi:hypothetical protein